MPVSECAFFGRAVWIGAGPSRFRAVRFNLLSAVCCKDLATAPAASPPPAAGAHSLMLMLVLVLPGTVRREALLATPRSSSRRGDGRFRRALAPRVAFSCPSTSPGCLAPNPAFWV